MFKANDRKSSSTSGSERKKYRRMGDSFAEAAGDCSSDHLAQPLLSDDRESNRRPQKSPKKSNAELSRAHWYMKSNAWPRTMFDSK